MEVGLHADVVGGQQDVLRRGVAAVLQHDVREVLLEDVEERDEVVVAARREVRRTCGETQVALGVGGFVGHLERAYGDVAVALPDEVGTEVVEEVGLAGVGLAGDDDEPSAVGEVPHAVGERSHADVVAVVVEAVCASQHVVAEVGGADDVARAHAFGAGDDLAHCLLAVLHEYVADVLAARGERADEGACAEVLGERLYQLTSGTVAVAAHHDVTCLLHPSLEGLEALGHIRLRAVGDGDHMVESCLTERHGILLAFGDDEVVHVGVLDEQRIDAVDVVGCAGGDGRLLRELLLADIAILHVHGTTVHVVHVDDAVALPAYPHVGERLHTVSHAGEPVADGFGEGIGITHAEGDGLCEQLLGYRAVVLGNHRYGGGG